MPAPKGRREAGSGTVLAAGLAVALLLLVLATVWLGQAVVAAGRAATAADMAALAAADTARGLADGEPCRRAAELAARQHATLSRCAVLGAARDTVEVAVEVRSAGLPWPARGRARAGPPPATVGPEAGAGAAASR
ncbi:Rv3654c family TadE-like protein [Specibacter sp. RAF43]|uniref:Rv3654c family TadE-like protein n=1 Tax=Specibacter sp. RAF43 TaxID=3233057 RepID=UPI003F9984AD